MMPGVPHARELAMWRRCAANGASARTIEILSRLGHSQMRRYVFGGAIPVHRGRNAYTTRSPFSATAPAQSSSSAPSARSTNEAAKATLPRWSLSFTPTSAPRRCSLTPW